MLDMGFIHDIRKIVAKLPIKRQTLFFSATMPKDIADLAEQMLRDPARVAVTPVASTVERITQRVIHVDHSAKPTLLAQLLKQDDVNRALVFTRTKHGADKVVKGLARAGIAADAIHGNKSQNHRERVLAAFRTGEIRTLVATDIAARGIDVDGITPCRQFRPAEHPGDLRPPHRPHRARRRRGHRDLAVRRRGGGVSARHREADPHHAAEGRPPHPGPSRTVAPPAPHRGGHARAARPSARRAASTHRDRRRRIAVAGAAGGPSAVAATSPRTRPAGTNRCAPQQHGQGRRPPGRRLLASRKPPANPTPTAPNDRSANQRRSGENDG